MPRKPIADNDPIPVYIMECERLGIKPRPEVLELLENMWRMFLERRK